MIAIIVLWIILGIIALIVILLHFSARIYVDAGNQGADIKVKYLFFTVFKLNTSDMKKKKTTEKSPYDDALAEEPKEKSAQSEKQFEDSLTIELEELDKLDEEESEAAVDGSEPVQVSEELTEEGREQVQKKPLTKEEKKALKEKKKLEKQLEREQKALNKAEKKTGGSRLDKLKAKYEFFKPFIPPTLKFVRKILKKIRFKRLEIDIYTAKEDPGESAIFYGKLHPIVFNVLSLLGVIFTVKLKRADINCGFFEKKLEFHVKTRVCVRPSSVIASTFCYGIKVLRLFLPGWWKRRRERKKAQKAEKKASKQAEKAAAAAV